MMDVEEDGAVRIEEALLQHSPLYTIRRMLSMHGAGRCEVIQWCLWSSGRVRVRMRVIQASLVSFALTPTSPALPHSNTCGLYQTRLVSYLTCGPATECLSNDTTQTGLTLEQCNVGNAMIAIYGTIALSVSPHLVNQPCWCDQFRVSQLDTSWDFLIVGCPQFKPFRSVL